MATNPLYLNTLPSTEKEYEVELTLVKGQSDTNVSLSEFMNQMCAMVQLLHLVEGELALNQSKMAAQNNKAADINVLAVTAEGNQAIEATKAAIAAEHEPLWKKLLIALFTAVMVVASYFTFGVTGVVLAALTLIITAVPIPSLGGKTLMGALSSKIAEDIGKANGWSQAKIQEVTGILNLVGGVLLAIATFGGGMLTTLATATKAVATVVEDVAVEMTDVAAEEVSNVVDTVVEDTAEAAANVATTSGKAVKYGFSAFSAINAFVSQVTNSNCIEDMMMGTLLNINPGATEKEKEAIAGIAAALNLIVAIIGAFLGGKIAISSIGEDLAEGSSFLSSATAQKLIGTVETANGLGQAGMNAYQGIVDINVGELNAAVTRIEGAMQSSKQLSAQIDLTMNQINTAMRDFADEYKALESNLRNIGMYDSSEVNALLKGNQQA
jgi:hypothetical protein